MWLRCAEATSTSEAPCERLFAILADHERYHEWLPGVESVRVLDREGDVAVVQVRAPRLYNENIVVELIESAPRELRFRRIGSDLAEISGRCELDEAAGRSRVRLVLCAETPLWRPGNRRRLQAASSTALEALIRRLEELGSQEAPPAPGRRKILEVLERDDGLEIRLRGQHYRLVRVDGEEAP